MQTRLGSLTETISNLVIGFFVSMVVNGLLLPYMGHHVTIRENLIIVLVFTVVSVIRSYSLRRFFNWIAIRFRF